MALFTITVTDSLQRNSKVRKNPPPFGRMWHRGPACVKRTQSPERKGAMPLEVGGALRLRLEAKTTDDRGQRAEAKTTEDRGEIANFELRIANLKNTGQIKKRKRQTRGQGETVKDDRE
jgi:hypothetical protein